MRFFNPISFWTTVPLSSRTTVGIKSVQYFPYTFASGGTTKATTITSVNTAKAVVINLGFTCASAGAAINTPSRITPWLTLTDATTVTATRASGADDSSNNLTGTGSFVVVEFN